MPECCEEKEASFLVVMLVGTCCQLKSKGYAYMGLAYIEVGCEDINCFYIHRERVQGWALSLIL